MIAFLKGKVVSVSESRLVLDVNDVGFQISITSRDAARMPSVGHQVLLYTYLSVREDAMQLFGFLSEDDLEIYRLLIGVSGIGPKRGWEFSPCFLPMTCASRCWLMTRRRLPGRREWETKRRRS